MPVIGLTFRSISATRSEKAPSGEIRINSTPKVNDIKEVSVATLKKKALAFQFEFVTRYDPDLAELKIEGELLYLADKNELILKQWKKKKTIPENVSVEILNHLFRRCLLKMAVLADDLQLPPPIQIPRVTTKKQTPAGVG